MIHHDQDHTTHNAATTSESASIGTATSETQPAKLTAHSHISRPPSSNDDRMPRNHDSDRSHFVQNFRNPPDAVPIPIPGMEKGVGRPRSKPGASNAPKPSNNLHSNHAFSPFSGSTTNPHYSHSAKRRPHEQSHAAQARRSSDHEVLSDSQDGRSMRHSKRQKTEAMHSRSQSSPVGPTVDLTEDSPPSPLGQIRAPMNSHHGQSSKAHSTGSGLSTAGASQYSQFFGNEPYDLVHDKVTSFKKPKQEPLEYQDSRPQPAVAKARNSLNRLSDLIDSESPSPRKRRGSSLNIGKFSPGNRNKARHQPGTENEAHHGKFQPQGAPGKSPHFVDNAADRPAQDTRARLMNSSAPSLTSAHPFKEGRLKVFSVPSTQIFDDGGKLFLEAQPNHSEFNIVNENGPIPCGRARLSITVAEIKGLAYSSESPWRIQVVGSGGPNDWKRFEFHRREDFDSFLEALYKKGSLMTQKSRAEMQQIFEQEYVSGLSSLSPVHDQERSLLDSRANRTNGGLRNDRSDHSTDDRPRRPGGLVSQMRPDSGEAPAELGSSSTLHPEQASRRLTRSTNNIAKDDYSSWSVRQKSQETEVPKVQKYSEYPGFGKEWTHSVVFPTAPKARFRGVVCYSDLERLDDGEFLNDSIISFCMAWSLNEAKEKNALDEDRIHIFSSFFCTKLWEPPTTNGINYEAVQRWTTKIDLFSRDFIIVPVNDAQHWHLAIIVNMKNAGMPLDEGAADTAVEEDAPPSDLKLGVMKTMGPRKSESLGAPKKEGQRDSPARGATKTKALDPRRTTILILDSLGTTHPKTVRTLKQYIIAETKDKKGRELTAQDIQNVNVKDIPLQPNGYDCGVFVCGYFDKFVRDPDGFVHKIMHKQMDQVADWPDLDPVKMRRDTIETLLALEKQQHEERRQTKKKKKQEIENKKSSTPKESSPEKPSADSSKRQSPAATTMTDSSTEPPKPMQEKPSNQAQQPPRRRSPQVVVPKKASPLNEDPNAIEKANAETSFRASENTLDQPLGKNPDSEDDDLLLMEEKLEPKRPKENLKSPSKKSKSPAPSYGGQKGAWHAAATSIKEDHIESHQRGPLFDAGAPPARQRGYKKRTLNSEYPSPAHAATKPIAQDRYTPPDARSNMYSHNPSPHDYSVRQVNRHNLLAEVGLDNSDDDLEEVDFVSTKHHDLTQCPERAMTDAGNDAYSTSVIPDSQQPDTSNDWKAQLFASAEQISQSQDRPCSPPSENMPPNSGHYSNFFRSTEKEPEVMIIDE